MNIDHLLTAAVAVTLAGCASVLSSGTSGSARQDMLLGIPLAGSPSNAGEMGRATLVGRGDQTDVTITVSGVPPGVTRPVHLHTYIHRGACGALSHQPVHSLNDRVLTTSASAKLRRNGPYTVRNSTKVPLAALQATPHAIVVKSAPADGNLDLFCGDIAAQSQR